MKEDNDFSAGYVTLYKFPEMGDKLFIEIIDIIKLLGDLLKK